MPAWPRLTQGTPKQHASMQPQSLLQTRDPRTPRSAGYCRQSIHRSVHAQTGNTDINALPGSVSHESITYQFSCIHWMASFSLNCFSNSHSCKVNIDMFFGAVLQSLHLFSAPPPPAPSSGALLPVLAFTVGGNEYLVVLVKFYVFM